MHRPLIIDPVTSNQIGQSSHFSPIRHYQTKRTILMAPQIPPNLISGKLLRHHLRDLFSLVFSEGT